MQPQTSALHADVLERVFSLLDADTLAAARLVCRDWAAAGLAATCTAYPAVTADFAVAERMTGLRHLHVQAKRLCPAEQNALAAYLAQVPSLQALRVWPNLDTFEDACSTAFVAAIATCTSLCRLHLAGCPPELLHSISSLTSLTELHIRFARSSCKSVALQVLQNLKRLQALEIDVCAVTEICFGAAVAALPDLTTFALRTDSPANYLVNPVLGRQLTSFSLEDTLCPHSREFDDVFRQLATCGQLLHLSVRNEGGYDDDVRRNLTYFASYLPRLSTLQSLSLQPACECIHPVWTVLAEFSAPRSLKCLEVTRACVEDTWETMRECSSSDIGKQTEAVLQSLTDLTSLRLDPRITAQVHAGAAGALSRLTALRRLSINPGSELRGLGQLRQLQRLDLQNLDMRRSAERAEQLVVLGCLPQLAARRLHFDSNRRILDSDRSCIDLPELPSLAADVGNNVLQAVCLCTSLRTLHMFQIYEVNAAGLAALPQLRNLASLVISSVYQCKIPAADLAAPLQRMPQLRFLDCKDWGYRHTQPRTYQLEGLPGRLLVRHPVGEAPVTAWSRGFVGTERLAGLDY